MLSLFSPWPWITLGLVAAASFLNGMHFDSKYGPNARRLAAIEQQLAATNAALAELNTLDEAEIPKEDATRDQASDSGIETLKRFGSHCPATQVDADVLMGISR